MDKKNGLYKFILSALKNNQLEFNGNPESKREFINVEDAAACTVEILDEKYSLVSSVLNFVFDAPLISGLIIRKTQNNFPRE